MIADNLQKGTHFFRKYFIKKKYGAGDIKWVMAEDKALIGGFILQVDGKEYDYSVQGRLNRLERKLTN